MDISNEESSSSRRRHGRNLIVGGTIVEPGSYPYFVEIGDYCGGSLIAPDIVLTAGHHCKPNGKLSDVSVRVGAYQRTQESLHTKGKDGRSSYNSHNNANNIPLKDTSETFQIAIVDWGMMNFVTIFVCCNSKDNRPIPSFPSIVMTLYSSRL